MIKKLIALTVALWATGVSAQEGGITVDEPIICLNAESMSDVVTFFRAGGFEFVNQWVDETSSDCFRVGLIAVPDALIDRFIILEASDVLNYGYIPVSEGRIKFYMFFMTVIGGQGEMV